MKYILILLCGLITVNASSQSVIKKQFDGTSPGFLSNEEKLKQIPASSPLSKMKLSGNSFFLSASSIKHDAGNYCKFISPAYVYPDQVCFERYATEKSQLQLFFTAEKAKGCLVEMNLWLIGNGKDLQFNVKNGTNEQTFSVDTKFLTFQKTKLVIPLYLNKGLNTVAVYCKSQSWTLLNSHISFME